ncbi:beta-lactamase family protein [Rouxiella badensis]|jgi:CubicO group peptidase (beta-lactamase class C family)|uniref:Serine hydrolase n=1 Tax=Rouxiella badensis TaxID=1646377 RepID=A0A1X0WII4_9GAMM|nr:serine hydrolase domain-containing protein [Rouxiella badensis]MCC3748571.1 beta-lactamase family protein [Rouxiella badensis]ORJ26595.1 serine hydrolase [Rouxiella badensis]QII37992.1 beta-lactamase family protein [Rouxiella badensis]
MQLSALETKSSEHQVAETSPFASVDAVIQRALEEKRLVGAVVMVAYRGETRYQRAHGWADRETQQVMSLTTLFRLSSVSKPIVTAAAMVLVQQGRLHLEQSLNTLLADFHPRLPNGEVATITVRQLMSHTAGFGYRFLESDEQGPYARAGVSDGMDDATHSLSENLQRIADVPLLFTPGSAWCYSLSVDVLGAVIEQVCGQRLDQAVKALIVDPLQMHDSGFYTLWPERLATAYVNDRPEPHILQENEYVAPFPDTAGIRFSPKRILNPEAFPSAGAGMVGSAPDLLRFFESLRSGKHGLLSKALIEEMGRDQTAGAILPDAPGFGFGLGFSVLRDPEEAGSPESVGTWRWGGVYGHSWFVDAQRELTVVALTNTMMEGMSGAFVNELRDAVYASLSGVTQP